MAGDFVSQEAPKTAPNIIAKSSLGFLANFRDKYSDKIPQNDNRESAVARRSKKKVKGRKRYKREGKNDLLIRNRKTIEPAPAKMEIILPATRGSSINFKLIAVSHINKGCLPSL